MFERPQSLSGNNKARNEPSSKSQRISARIMNNSSGKTVANSGKVNYRKQYISKVPLRKPNSEAVLKTQDNVNDNSPINAIKSHRSIIEANNSNEINSQADMEIEFGLRGPEENVSNIKNIFYKEVECVNRLENDHLLVDVIEELRDIKKTLSKPNAQSLKKFSSMNRSQVIKKQNMDKHILERTCNTAKFCGFDGVRPSTAPNCCTTVSDVKLKSSCYSSMKFAHESDSKIPIRANKEMKQKHSNIQIEAQNFESLTRSISGVIEEKGKLSLPRKFSILPISKRRQSSFGKKYNYRRQRNSLKEHLMASQSDHEIGTALAQSEEIRKELPNPTKSKNLSRIPQTISSVELDSQIKLDKGAKNNDNLQKFESRIPVGVKSNIGIVARSIKAKSSKNLEFDFLTEKEGDTLEKLQSNTVSKYQVMAVPNLIYPEVAKLMEDKENKLVERTKCFCNVKRIEVINDRALEAKRGYPNICKLNPQFCSGDKRKNNKILLRSQFPRRPPRGNENKLKLRKPCIPRNASTRKEFDLKAILSSPDARTRKFNQNAIKSKTGAESSDPERSHNNKSRVREEVRAPKCETKSLSDTNLLKRNSGNYANMYYSDEKCSQEKSIQTQSNTSTIEVQANVTLNNSYSEGNTNQIDVKPKDSFGVIRDYCVELVKVNETLEKLLTHYKAAKYFSGIDIGCQVEVVTPTNSYTQTDQSISFSLTELHYKNNLVPCSHIVDVFENIQRKSSLFLTLSECSSGLDRNNSRRTMSCYCKELSPEEQNKPENKREPNLYNDDYDDDEYSECYMKELLYSDHVVETDPCGSTPSLPEVVAPSDRCESKIEIPWLKISLAPPGYYEIKTMPGRPKEVVCDCWALSTGDDVYSEPVHHVYKEEQECKCKNVQGKTLTIELEPHKSQSKQPEKPIVTPVPSIPKKTATIQSLGKPVYKSQSRQSEKAMVTSVPSLPRKADTMQSLGNEPPSGEEQFSPAVEGTPSAERELAPPAEEEQPPAGEQQPPAEEQQPPAEEEQPPLEETQPSHKSLTEDITEEKPRPTPKTSFRGEDGKPLSELEEDSSSSSVPSTCTCMDKTDECADMLGRPTNFVYENSCYGCHEAYLDPIYKLFPEDCDTYCGPYIEMPWSQLTIPRNIKLRQAKKVTKGDKDCKCEKKESKDKEQTKAEEKEIIVCGNKDDRSVPSANSPQSPSENPPEKIDKSFEIQLSFTEILGNIKNLDKDTVPSSSGCHCRPQSPRGKPQSPEACPERANYNCKCSSSKSQRSPPKPRSPKCKNSNCKSAASSVRIDPTPSYNNDYIQQYSTFSRKPVQNTQIPSKKGHYQDQVMNVLETCEAEMEPLRDTLNQLKSKIRNLNIPELNNWNTCPSPPCPPCPPGPTPMFQGMRPPAPPLPQYPFPPMFSGLSSQMPQMPPKQRPRTCCCVKERRSRKKSPGSASSRSTDFSEFDSLSDEESPCPFLRALSSKSIYKGKDTRSQRKIKAREGHKYERHCKRPVTCAARRNNKKNQADYLRQDNATDTEPEIQVHYGPTRPRMKTKQLFKSVIDPNLIAAKNQRLRIAVKVTPSDAEASNDKLLAIQGPYESSKLSRCSGCKRSQ